MTTSTGTDVGSLTVRELLRLSAAIVTELNHRGVLRSRNAPAGDLAEYLVAKAYHGELAAPAVKSWDVQAAERKLQVKCRLVAPGSRRTESFSPFRSWEFDACVFVALDCHTYDVVQAVEIPMVTERRAADVARSPAPDPALQKSGRGGLIVWADLNPHGSTLRELTPRDAATSRLNISR